MEYATIERRTTRKDLKRKERYNKYKKGGSYRITNRDGRRTQSD